MVIVNYLSVFIVSFLTVYLFTPFVRFMALQLYSIEKKNYRKVHNKIITNLGGISIYTGFLLGLMVLYTCNIGSAETYVFHIKSLVICSFIVLLLGIYDDLQGSDAYIKLTVQLVASLLLIKSGFILDHIFIPNVVNINLGEFSVPVTLLWLLGITNAINLIDGLDGLAAGILAIAFLTLFVCGIIFKNIFISFISLSLAGASLAFLKYNLHPAKIFLGDTGSLSLGFIVGSLAIYPSGVKNNASLFLFPTAIVLFIPIIDTSYAIIRRALKRQNIFRGDASHIHHLCLKIGISHPETVKRFHIITAILAIISIGTIYLYRCMR